MSPFGLGIKAGRPSDRPEDYLSNGTGVWPTPASAAYPAEYACGGGDVALAEDPKTYGDEFSLDQEGRAIGYRLLVKHLPAAKGAWRIRINMDFRMSGSTRRKQEMFYLNGNSGARDCSLSLLASDGPLPPGRYRLQVTLQGVPSRGMDVPGLDHFWSTKAVMSEEFAVLP
jgi:hypothetical protein